MTIANVVVKQLNPFFFCFSPRGPWLIPCLTWQSGHFALSTRSAAPWTSCVWVSEFTLYSISVHDRPLSCWHLHATPMTVVWFKKKMKRILQSPRFIQLATRLPLEVWCAVFREIWALFESFFMGHSACCDTWPFPSGIFLSHHVCLGWDSMALWLSVLIEAPREEIPEYRRFCGGAW